MLNAKYDLINLHYHCLESLLRLFIALNSKLRCVNIALVDLNSTTFREYIKKISKNDFTMFNYSAKEAVLKAFVGRTDNINQFDEGTINNWLEWIVVFAKELLDSNENNTYKHGFSLRSSNSKIALKNQTFSLEKEGDTLISYKKTERNNRLIWCKRTKFIDYDIIITEIVIASKIIKSMIELRKNKNSTVKVFYPSKEYNLKNLFKDRELSECLTSLEIDLLYYKE